MNAYAIWLSRALGEQSRGIAISPQISCMTGSNLSESEVPHGNMCNWSSFQHQWISGYNSPQLGHTHGHHHWLAEGRICSTCRCNMSLSCRTGKRCWRNSLERSGSAGRQVHNVFRISNETGRSVHAPSTVFWEQVRLDANSRGHRKQSLFDFNDLFLRVKTADHLFQRVRRHTRTVVLDEAQKPRSR